MISPGPWFVREEEVEYGGSGPVIQRYISCPGEHGNPGPLDIAEIKWTDEEDERDDAVLLAAAWEMRQILANLVEWDARMGNFDSPYWQQARDILNRFRPNPGCDACGTNDAMEGSKLCEDCAAESPRVIVFVDGGIVQEVKANTRKIHVDVYDYDNASAEEREEEKERFAQLEKEYDELPYMVY